MTNNEQDQLKDEVQRDVLRAFGVRGAYWLAGVFIVLAWILYGCMAVFKIDLLAFTHTKLQYGHDEFDYGLCYLITAIVLTVVAVPWCIIYAKKMRYLANNGVRTQGKLLSKGLIGRRGMVPATIAFSVRGKDYKIRKDIRDKDHNVGDEVWILYDPANPKRCEIIY